MEFTDFDVASCGVDDAEAFQSAKELLGLIIYGMEQDKEELPKPSGLSELHLEANQRSIMVEVYMLAIRFANVKFESL